MFSQFVTFLQTVLAHELGEAWPLGPLWIRQWL